MKEQFLHFVWQYHRFNHHQLQTIQGQPIQILDYGQSNPSDGPDFLFAKIKIGNVLWVGHVEIHINSSDWDKHQHSKDENYKNVILHVVYHHDKNLSNFNSPTLELAGLIPKSIYERYLYLQESPNILPCQHLIPELDSSIITMYMYRLAIERLEIKVHKIEELLEKHQNDFEQVAFIWLSRYFGIGSNSDAFQELATQTPINWLYKIQNEPEDITALLMGSAGFLKYLPENEKYLTHLTSQFEHFQNKWKIKTLEPQWWKWKMGRPSTFPSLKLAQLSKLLVQNPSVFQLILDEKKFVQQVTTIVLHPFWDEHYILQSSSVNREKGISLDFANRLLINVSVPLMLAYGRYLGDSTWSEKALEILEQLPPEKNKITKAMQSSGLMNQNAMDSQALLHLKNEYCDRKKCLNCQIGNKIICSNTYQLQEADVNLRQYEAYI